MKFSIVIPAKNEEEGLRSLLPRLRQEYPVAEIIVVDDGSTDKTIGVCADTHVRVISHPYSKGNGAAIKTGARAASGDYLVFMDGDGQHDSGDVKRLLEEIDKGYDMVIGARSGRESQASVARWGANFIYNQLASWMVNHRIDDLTSGLRCVDREKFLGFLYLLPNGFSYPTTSTMAFFRAGFSVGYIPVAVRNRVGKSHIHPVRDGVRFFLIIFKIGSMYSPMKVYFPASLLVFSLGVANYFFSMLAGVGPRFTNMSTLLLLSGMIIFLIGLLSEQLSNLQFKDSDSG
ncbi:MAG: glycosyltransferase family 2 protein [Halioglobus sp.]